MSYSKNIPVLESLLTNVEWMNKWLGLHHTTYSVGETVLFKCKNTKRERERERDILVSICKCLLTHMFVQTVVACKQCKT